MTLRQVSEKQHDYNWPDIVFPAFVCDVCEEIIEDANKANVLWRVHASTGRLADVEDLAVRKGQCNRVFEAANQHPEWDWHWEEFRHYVRYLMVNSNLVRWGGDDDDWDPEQIATGIEENRTDRVEARGTDRREFYPDQPGAPTVKANR